MNRPVSICLALLAFSLLAVPTIAQARAATCYVLVEEGSSKEGNSLYFEKMGLDPELLSRVAPTRFSFNEKDFEMEASGSFSYRAETPVLVGRSGSAALYSVNLEFTAGPLPKARKTVVVRFRLSDLIKGGKLVQPAARAMRLAAAEAGLKSGMAWIGEMTMPSRGEFRARVLLAR